MLQALIVENEKYLKNKVGIFSVSKYFCLLVLYIVILYNKI